ncbi:MAG: tRNA uracil 4-sulfurtransferase ThiI [Candidatus Hodarchaeales archaeon]|jgi:thiamine biosynthesis protein ThiI
MESIVVHYGELALKGGNRPFFERCLIQDIQNRFPKAEKELVQKQYGRIVVKNTGKYNLEEMKRIMGKIPGIVYFAPAVETALDIQAIEKALLESYEPTDTFRITARRSNKSFSLTSSNLNEKLGALLVKERGAKVDLSNPTTTYYVEIGEKSAFLYKKKIKGMGGLPLGSMGKLVALMSGGIDSPVAAYHLIRRGCKVVLVHFFNNQRGVRDKIYRIAEVLCAYQPGITLHLVPFLEIQREIIKFIPSRFRMLVYRRAMFRLAEKIRNQEGAKGFITGDSVGQVASQTLENLHVIHNVANQPVLCPLIGLDKQQIVDLAQDIGTFQYSILPYSDCCSFMIGAHPETRAKLAEIEALELQLELEDFERRSIEATEKQKFPSEAD